MAFIPMIVELVEHSRYHSVFIWVEIFYQKNPALRSLPSISILATPHPSYRIQEEDHQGRYRPHREERIPRFDLYLPSRPLQPHIQAIASELEDISPCNRSSKETDPTEEEDHQGGYRPHREEGTPRRRPTPQRRRHAKEETERKDCHRWPTMSSVS